MLSGGGGSRREKNSREGGRSRGEASSSRTSGQSRSRSRSRSISRKSEEERNALFGNSEERYGREIVKDRRDDPRYLRDELQNTQKASVDATRDMIRLLKESTAVSEASLDKLDRQGESLSRSELKALATNVSAKQAREEARDLKKYSKIFAISWPSWTKSKQRKELERAEKALKEQEMIRLEEECALRQEERERMAVRSETERSQLFSSIEEHSLFQDPKIKSYGGAGAGAGAGPSSSSSSRKTFANDKDNEHWDNTENELDQNLNEISSLLSNLKVNATTMNAKITDQSRQIDRINQSADNTSSTLSYTKKALRKI